VQPLFADFAFGGLALGHNGNLTNALVLRRQLVEQGCLFQSTSDTEVIIHLIARSRQPTVIERLIDALSQVQGAYALVALSADALYGVRDPLGIRPLVIGDLDGAPILASETCALDIMGARFVRDVEPGEVVSATLSGIESVKPFGAPPRRFCIFEYVYFARPQRGRGAERVRGQKAHRRRAGA
jgi:amidophosphoribosyltransferase